MKLAEGEFRRREKGWQRGFHTTLTFEAAVLEAANLGEDGDTTAAIVGQVAGAFYGVRGIPAAWLKKLHLRAEIMKMAEDLYEFAQRRRTEQALE